MQGTEHDELHLPRFDSRDLVQLSRYAEGFRCELSRTGEGSEYSRQASPLQPHSRKHLARLRRCATVTIRTARPYFVITIMVTLSLGNVSFFPSLTL